MTKDCCSDYACAGIQCRECALGGGRVVPPLKPEVVENTDKFKLDTGKVRMELLYEQFAAALMGVSNVLTKGAEKYPHEETCDRSWRLVKNGKMRYLAAFHRHFYEFMKDLRNTNLSGSRLAIDEEIQELHIDQCITNLLFLRDLVYGSQYELPKLKENI